jgi:hypothetical protein
MPPLVQKSWLCKVCFQRFYEEEEVWRHFKQSHGDEGEVLGEKGERDGDEGEGENDSEDECGRKDEGEGVDVSFPTR